MRKLGQVEIKVWTPKGGRWFEKSTRNLTPFEYASMLRDMAKRLLIFADGVDPLETITTSATSTSAEEIQRDTVAKRKEL